MICDIPNLLGVRTRMIPRDKIDKQHVLAALAEIDTTGVPESRIAKSFDLVYDGKSYPPKYVLSIAVKNATGHELDPASFSGGEATNSILRELGFEVVERKAQSLRDNIERVMERYVTARTGEQFGRNSDVWGIFTELKRALRQLGPVQSNSNLQVKASVGQGNWTKVPWIALLDERETDTTQKGVYSVFLFRQDMSGVYLTLAQGVTEPQKRFGMKEARSYLHRRSVEIRAYISDLKEHGFLLDDGIDLKADPGLGADYADSVIAYKLYPKGSVPDDETIEADVAEILNAYGRYQDQKPTQTAEDPRTWIFQANPEYYDLAGALSSLKQQTWRVSAHENEMRVGDTVYLWESGINAGIVGSAKIDAEPKEIESNPEERSFGRDESRFASVETRAVLGIQQVFKNRLLRSELLEDPVLQSLQVIRQPRGTNFLVTPAQAKRIEELVNANNPELLAPESGLAGLQQLTFLSSDQLKDIEHMLMAKKQIIFEGPPGSGKTYVARLFARYFAGVPLQGSPSGQVRIVQFHQSYSYEDFVEGIRPETKDGHIEYAIAPGIFRRICKDAADDLEEKRYVIIIDEINHGNISRIFGELLMLLEYRDLEVELPYQKDGSTFFIPKNVFVIGTMNTTDRSLAQIDYALRRRFFFYRLSPVVGDEAPVLNRWLESQVSFSPDEKQEVLRLFVALNSRVRKELGEHFQIGHSYFMHPDIRTGTGRKRIWEHAVIPLLEEYFYNRRDRDSLLAEFGLERLFRGESSS
jgi:5-methylcytosine-specific restriction protein B